MLNLEAEIGTTAPQIKLTTTKTTAAPLATSVVAAAHPKPTHSKTVVPYVANAAKRTSAAKQNAGSVVVATASAAAPPVGTSGLVCGATASKLVASLTSAATSASTPTVCTARTVGAAAAAKTAFRAKMGSVAVAASSVLRLCFVWIMRLVARMAV